MERHKCWQGRGETGALVHCRWECKMVRLPWEAEGTILRKLNRESHLIWHSHFRAYSPKCRGQDSHRHPCSGQEVETKCPVMGKRINEMWYTHKMEYYSASKKQNKILTQAAARMNIKDMTLGKTSPSQKDRLREISLTRVTRVVQYRDRMQNGC